MKNPRAAHIFPPCILNPRPKARNKMARAIPGFWQSLSLFWNQDRINKWEKAIFPDSEDGVGRSFNLISLAIDAHDMWNRGIFALKPVELSSDRKTLTVRFFWQVPGNYEIDRRIDLLTEPISSEGLTLVADGYFLSRIEEEGITPRIRHISSGDIFTLTTKDPQNLPLPSVDLLEMQWFLQRLVGMSGAAGWPSLDDDDDDSIDNDDVGLVSDDTYSNVHNSLKRVYEWVDAETAGITPQISTPPQALL